MNRREPTRPHAGLARDDALRRASTLTKWAGVGAVALAGALAGFVAQAKPGHSTTSNESSRASRAPRESSPAETPSPTRVAPSPSLAPPPAPPAPAPSSSGVPSGGS